MRLFGAAVLLCIAGLSTAADKDPINEAAARLEKATDKTPAALAAQFRELGAQALKEVRPDLAQRFTTATAASNPNGKRKLTPADPAQAALSPDAVEGEKLEKRIREFRGMATDADRAKAAIEVANGIRKLSSPDNKLSVAMSLSNLATEGNLGQAALTAVAGALAESIRAGSSSEYLQLAKYIRYEHVRVPVADPALDCADALLALREAIQAGKEFTLTSMDGKTYSLKGLRGKVVLLNFWATWCPPCRKEMPDMEKLYREYQKDGFVVLVVSDEDRQTVTGFLKKEKYSFPVLLDSDRKANTAFDVEGIPKSFLFDREGRIVARSIDMRTEPQFREMLKLAGLR